MKKITELTHIDYKNNPEGRLLFAALAILTTDNYPDKTPDEAISIINAKADSFLPATEPQPKQPKYCENHPQMPQMPSIEFPH